MSVRPQLSGNVGWLPIDTAPLDEDVLQQVGEAVLVWSAAPSLGLALPRPNRSICRLAPIGKVRGRRGFGPQPGEVECHHRRDRYCRRRAVGFLTLIQSRDEPDR
jgi:hypothetical protein